jgi:ElaB/YqjD/DUF883 family membrane-anchored ribosome-binding protein
MALEQAHETVARAEHELHSATDWLARAAHQAVDSLSDYGRPAEERLRETGRVARERSRELAEQVTHYVEEHPLVAVGMAVAVGFAVGMMIGASGEREDAGQEGR